jgi:hypothetical protein
VSDKVAFPPVLSEEAIKKSLEKLRLEEEQRKKRASEPPNRPTGICVHCSGEVSADWSRESRYCSSCTPIGGRSPTSYWKLLHYSCKGCGLLYKFPPNQTETEEKRHED